MGGGILYKFVLSAGVNINTGLVACSFFCLSSEICYPLAQLACKILKPYFWVYMA